jgi:hypothetical protein
MTKIATAVLATAAFLYPALASAQRSTDLTAKQAPSTPVLAPLAIGTAFNASLTESLDTRRAKAGDAVTAEVAEDVAYERSIIFPKGTKVLGHVVRATSGGRGRAGSALFVQFDRAVLSGGEEVLLNVGIQALAVTSLPPLSDTDLSKRAAALARNDSKLSESSAEPVSDSAATSAAPLIVSTDYNQPRTSVAPPLSLAPKAQGELNSDGLFSPDSVGAFGRPDLKVYTPVSQGSHGTVLLSAKKQMRLESGTRLLLVVQPPPSAEPDARGNVDLSDVTPKP